MLVSSLAAAPSRAFLPSRRPTQRCSLRSRPMVVRTTAYLKAHDQGRLQQTVDRALSALNARDPEALCQCLTDKVVWSDRVWSRDDWVGHKKVKKVHGDLFTAFPDFHIHAEDVLSRPDSNCVAVHWTATGTNKGLWRGRPGSGRRSTFSGVSLFVFDSERDDRIREVVVYRQPSTEEREPAPAAAEE